MIGLALMLCAAAFGQQAAELAAAGVRELEAGNVQAARRAFEESLRLDAKQYEALSGLGFIHYSQGSFEQAKDRLEKAIALRPNSFQSRFLLGASLVQLDDAEGAIVQLKRAVALQASHSDARKLLASQYVRTRRYREAVALLQPADEESCLLLIEARQASGDSAGALRLATQAAQRYPRSAQLAAWLGFQMQFAGRYEEARKLLLRSIELDSSFAVAYQLLGEVFLKEEQYAEASQWFARAVEKMPEDVETLLGYGRALALSGKLSEAEAVLEQAVKAAPKDARVQLQLSRLYFQMGDEGRARAAAVRSVEMREAAPVADTVPAGLRSRGGTPR
ncbi:MAG: tetratricopeptide repeat protein [Acidobacteria bacterium]|nr:tetratricopeptide repeat protein [Acidobacteriota bacterium]